MDNVIAVKDPVCGMKIEPGSAPMLFNRAGRTHYFCGPVCMQKFTANPEHYPDNSAKAGDGHDA